MAQSDVRIETIDISLWPEFDRPEMLVIYRIILAEDTVLPAEVSFRIPTRAGEPHAVADGAAGDKNYSLDVQGEWTVVSFTAEDIFLQLEYYDSTLNTDSNPRQYDYVWPADYAAANVEFTIKLPGDADDVVITPSFGLGQTAEDGYIYYNANAGELVAGEPVSIGLEYQRGGIDFQQFVIWGIGALGLVLIAWGGYRFISESRSSKKSSRRRAKPTSRAGGGTKFCHNCGTAANKGDRFCRSCGTELR